jgi:subtilisin-like proprotein convertase family protein
MTSTLTSIRRCSTTVLFLCCLSLPAAAGFRLYETCRPANPADCAGSFVAIPDLGTGVMMLTVPSDGGAATIEDIRVDFWIDHSYQGDLRIELVSPAGTVVRLVNRPGAGGFSANDFGGWCQDEFSAFHFRPFRMSSNAAEYASIFSTTCPTYPRPYDAPTVAPPGIDYESYGFCPSTAVATCPNLFSSVDPLYQLYGESKVGVWQLRAVDLAAGDIGAIRYFGLGITFASQPNVNILPPAAFACVCNPVEIRGAADDPFSSLRGYRLEYATLPEGPWTLISSSPSAVPGPAGLLGTWNTLGLSGGYYFLRLSATNVGDVTSTFSTIVYVDGGFGSEIRSIGGGPVIGGTAVCIDGTASAYCFSNYVVQYSPLGGSVYTTLTTSPAPVINDPLYSWNTTTLPDGDYTVRLRGTTTCGLLATDTVNTRIDNTAPTASITSPANCDSVDGIVTIHGTANDTNLAGWAVQYTGGPTHGWVTINSGSAPVVGGVLANWNTAGLPACAYTIRLVVSDNSVQDCGPNTHSSEFLVSVSIGFGELGDMDCDGDVDFNDIDPFVACLVAGGNCRCP